MNMMLDRHLLMHAAALTSFAALAFRDQLKLRSILLFSIILNIAYHFAGTPEWQELFWNIVTFIITLKVLIEIVLDRTHIGLSAEAEELFRAFELLTPGEFRRLMKVGSWRTAEDGTVLTREGEVPDKLFFVLKGAITVEKSGRTLEVAPETFIGEVAYLHKVPASATVRLSAGSRYVEWDTARLHEHVGAHHSLQNSVFRIIGHDMALKVARS